MRAEAACQGGPQETDGNKRLNRPDRGKTAQVELRA